MMMIEFNNLPGTQQVLSQPPAQHQPAAWPRAVKKIEKVIAKFGRRLQRKLRSHRKETAES